MFNVWQSVKVKTEGHAREGQAGTVKTVNPSHPDEVVVQFDVDSSLESVNKADLQAL